MVVGSINAHALLLFYRHAAYLIFFLYFCRNDIPINRNIHLFNRVQSLYPSIILFTHLSYYIVTSASVRQLPLFQYLHLHYHISISKV